MSSGVKSGCIWMQKAVKLGAKSRGCYIVTDEILAQLKNELQKNWDSDVPRDMEMMFNRLVPQQGVPYRHTCEGPDDMPGHVKSALVGASLCVPVNKGAFVLGTWQGVWLCEHRDRAAGRTIVATIQGAPVD